MRFENKVVVVTGAAQGIGEAYARALAAEGASVVVADLNAEAGEKVAADIGGLFVRTDVSSAESAGSMVEATVAAYGLSGSVESADLERAKAVAARIRTGTIAVNGGVWFSPDAPFGGYKQSGIGREMGVAGFEEYLETKTVAEPA